MAFGSNKEQIMELATLRAKTAAFEILLADKDKQLEILRGQLERTQEALIAKESPEAYREQQDDVAEDRMTDEEKHQRAQYRQQALNNGRLLTMLEDPLFKDADEMMSMLTRPENPPAAASVHGNDES